MTFTYDGADFGKIIKKFSKDGANFHLEYLDGSTSSYTCYSEKEIQRLVNLMIQQAKERDINIDLNELGFRKSCGLIGIVISSIGASALLNNNKQALVYILVAFLMYVMYDYKCTNKRIKELKKYKLFLEIAPHIEEINNSEILRSIEYDKIYQKKFNIVNLDDYSYGEVKTIYNLYKKKGKNI